MLGEHREIPIDLVLRGRFQPRTEFAPGELDDLANSIRQAGVVQPILVRPAGKQFELIAGERRWRAAQLAGLHDIPAVIRSLTDEQAAQAALIENIHRADLKPLEISDFIQRLIAEFGLTHEHVADMMGLSRPVVTNYLRLLRLSAPVRDLVNQGRLQAGHAKVLAGVTDPHQTDLAREAAKKEWSVRELERAVKRLSDAAEVYEPLSDDPDVRHLEQTLSERVGNAVRIEVNKKARGRLIINFNSNDELEGQLEKLFGYTGD
jgi:ParB family chromosome partitioning protein